MRITQNMLSNNMLRNLSGSYAKLGTYLEQLTSEKKVTRPSDDPVTVMMGMNYRTEVARINQYERNTGEVRNWMDNSDAALDKTTKALQRLKDLAIQASNDTYDRSQRQNMKEEVLQLKEHLIDIANTNVNGKHIFNGTDTDNPPITFDNDGNMTIDFNTEKVRIEVAAGTKLTANVDPKTVFGETDGLDLFAELDQFIAALDNDDNQQSAISNQIRVLDNRINKVINARADLGARMNRLDLVEDRLAEQKVVATKIMSDNEDVDIEKTITDLITQETIHRAALAAGSRITQPTLLDFLR